MGGSKQAPSTLWDSMFQTAIAERELKKLGRSVIARDHLPPEVTPFGILRWYLHPQLTEPATRALYFFEIDIPEGSRSGKLRHQGGIIHMVVRGSGYTAFEGEKHAWEMRDMIALPPRPEGVVFQHFNMGTGPVRMVVAFPNYDSALGPDLGVAMEVLEPAPEYEEQQAARD